MAAVGSPLSSPFPRFNKCSSFSLFPQVTYFCPLINSVALHRANSTIPMSFSCWGTQTQIQYSRCGLTSDKQQGIIISLKLLTTFLLIQHSVQSVFIATRVCCQLTLPLLFTRTFRSFSAKLLLSQLMPRLYYYSYSFSSAGPWQLPLLNFMSFAISPFLQPVQIPLNSSHIVVVVRPPPPPSLLSPTKPLRVHSQCLHHQEKY